MDTNFLCGCDNWAHQVLGFKEVKCSSRCLSEKRTLVGIWLWLNNSHDLLSILKRVLNIKNYNMLEDHPMQHNWQMRPRKWKRINSICEYILMIYLPFVYHGYLLIAAWYQKTIRHIYLILSKGNQKTYFRLSSPNLLWFCYTLEN